MNKKIEELYNKIDGLNNIIDQQVLEISQLKKQKKQAIEYIKNGIDFKSLHFIKGKDEDMWKIILVENVKNELLEILGDK